MAAPKRTWPPSRDERPYREVQDMLHGTIPLPHPLCVLIDTAEFQRLRRIQQLGTVSLVFPSCEHSRFVHSLGVYHLARLFVAALTEHSKHVHVSGRDQLCVCIAALCHDLGHGPLSHLFDGCFLPVANPLAEWRHEQGSVLIFERICAYPWVREALFEYLDDTDLLFIRELIDPPKERFSDAGEWKYAGRSVEKSFLYDIVSNGMDSVDVDKLDYLLRDAQHSAMAIPLNQNSLRRMRDWMLPLPVTEVHGGREVMQWRVCYAFKVCDDVASVGQSRYTLHDKLYSHHTVNACQALVTRALLKADAHLFFEGDHQERFNPSQTVHHITAFLRMNDSILSMIENSSSSELSESRLILSQLRCRRLPKLVGSVVLRQGECCTEDEISNRLCQLDCELHHDQLIVCLRSVHRGLGTERHPLSAVLFYEHKTACSQRHAFHLPNELLQHKASVHGGCNTVNVYVMQPCPQLCSRLHSVLRQFSLDGGHATPLLYHPSVPQR